MRVLVRGEIFEWQPRAWSTPSTRAWAIDGVRQANDLLQAVTYTPDWRVEACRVLSEAVGVSVTPPATVAAQRGRIY